MGLGTTTDKEPDGQVIFDECLRDYFDDAALRWFAIALVEPIDDNEIELSRRPRLEMAHWGDNQGVELFLQSPVTNHWILLHCESDGLPQPGNVQCKLVGDGWE
jgi:hypothetical protein